MEHGECLSDVVDEIDLAEIGLTLGELFEEEVVVSLGGREH